MSRETWGLFFTDRWTVARWSDPPEGYSWATKYQGPSERGAWTVAEIWNERRRRGLARQEQIRAKQRRSPRVSFRQENFGGRVVGSDKGGSLPAPSEHRGYRDAERVVQSPIISGIGPSKGPHVVATDSAAPVAPADRPGDVSPPRPPTTPRLHAALAKAQGKFPAIPLDATATISQGRAYRYASLTAILKAVRPVLSELGVYLRQEPEVVEGWCHLTTVLSMGDESIASTLSLPLPRGGPHELGSAITYLRRYALTSMLGIAGDEDEDGNAAQATAERGKDSPRTSKRKAAASKQPAPEPRASSPGASGDGAVKATGVITQVTEGTSKKGKPFWKVLLDLGDGQDPLLVFSWDPEVGNYIAEGQRSEITYEPGEYPKALSWAHLRDDGTSFLPGYGEVPF